MALIAASIDLTFNANFTGCHRVCWRPLGAPIFNCAQQVTCAGGGNPCSATIGIQVDDASCVPVTFEGYVQACCEDPASLNGRLPFSVTFTPNPNCVGYLVTCIGPVTVLSVIITNPGSGYLPGAIIPVTILGGGGAGATADALIGNGGVSTQPGATSVFPFGLGYVDGTYNNVPSITLTGVGVGAFFTVVVLGTQVISADIVPGSNGVGYLPGDTITFSAANLGGSGAGVVVTINIVNTGEVQSVVVTNPGAGYTSIPTATIPPPAQGIQAAFGVNMNPCTVANFTTCGNQPFPLALPLGTGFNLCASTAPVLPPDYSSVTQGCCNVCTSVTFSKQQSYTEPPATIYYEDCTTKQIVATIITAGGNIGPVCAVNGSWFVIETDPVNGNTIIGVSVPCS